MKVVRKFLKIMVLPLILLIGILHFILDVMAKLSCYVIGPLMLFLF